MNFKVQLLQNKDRFGLRWSVVARTLNHLPCTPTTGSLKIRLYLLPHWDFPLPSFISTKYQISTEFAQERT